MPAIAEPAPGLTLAAFDGPDAPPDNHVNPAGSVKPTPDAAPADTGPAKGIVLEPGELAKPDPEPTKRGPQKILDDMMEDPAAATRKEERERIAAEKEEADRVAADKAKEDAVANINKPAPVAERDADLTADHAPHVHPKTKKNFEAIAAKTKAARDERDAAIAEREVLKKERDELAERAKTTALPKETETELASLRDRVRELDITQDPIIQTKYDSKIAANNNTILAILKGQGLGMTVDPETKKQVENPAVIGRLMKDGLNLKTLQPYLAKLEEAELIEEAAEIREAVLENKRIARERQTEIDQWKGDHGRRVQERETLTKQQQERQSQAYRTQTETVLKADLDALAKDFQYINQPPAPLATDTPATAKAKQLARDEYDAAAKSIEVAVKAFDTTGVAADKLPEVVGRLNAHAIEAIVLKTHVLPRVKREMAAQVARIKELEGELTKIRGAGSLSRAHSAPTDQRPGDGGRPEPKSLDEAFGRGPVPGA